jgi:anti-anti-sigma regulatory factor
MLDVHRRGAAMIALVSAPSFQSVELNKALGADFDRLSQEPCELVVLDLRTVEFFPAAFISRIVKLSQLLKARAIPLRICAPAALRDVLRVSRLDRLFEIADNYDDLGD